ncbi:MAG: amidohydrolase [Nocardioides sp.]|nr:amidohydrolase [Nocardioides sp.]
MSPRRLLLRNGRVLPGATRPTGPLTAVAVEDGRVTWIGHEDEANAWAVHAEVVLDLDGRLVTPAFVDAHVHLAQTGFAETSVDLATPTLVTALDALAEHARSHTQPILLGHGWDDTHWPERRPFTRAEVDRATGGRPAYLARVDVHSAVVSSAFLDAVPAVTGAAGFDPDGVLTQRAHDVAREALFTLLPESSRADALLLALRAAAGQGIGAVHEMGAPHLSPVEDYARLDALALAHDGALTEVVRYWGTHADDESIAAARAHGCVGLAGDLCADGALGSRTSALRAPYSDDPSTAGALYLDVEQVHAHVVACTRAGLQGGFHVIGDRAVDTVLTGFQRAADELGEDALRAARHRLEHVEMIAPADAARLARWGVSASMQPLFDAYWGGESSLYAQRLGPERAAGMNPLATLADAGVLVALGSDTPVTPFGPWAAVRAAAQHQTHRERLPALRAFGAHTRAGWLAAGSELPGAGTLVPGAPASLAVWDVPGGYADGPLPLPDLARGAPLPACLLTVVHGRVAHEEPGALR